MADRDRRDFLKLATCAIGGGVGLAIAGPVVRMIVDPSGKTTVTTPKEPIDLGDPTRYTDQPRKVDIIAPVVQDAWVTARNVLLGAAWIRLASPGQLVALSGTCPHLGCAIGWDGKTFVCPCHDSKFAIDGKVMGGPAKRAMDELPLQVVDGKLLLTYKRFKQDTDKPEEA